MNLSVVVGVQVDGSRLHNAGPSVDLLSPSGTERPTDLGYSPVLDSDISPVSGNPRAIHHGAATDDDMTIEAENRELILASVDRLVQERIAPRAAEIDASNQFPSDLYAAVAELGLLGLWIPEEYGGAGPDLLTPLLISERFSLVFSNCGDAATPIVHAAPEHLKREWLPRIVSGEVIPCFSLSEPGAGSDAASIATRAERRGDEYVINGRKCWCTNGSVGGVYVLFAKTDPEARHKGVSAFSRSARDPGSQHGTG